MTRYPLGRQPNDPTKYRLHYSLYQTTAPTPPPAVDWTSDVTGWGMLGNDTVGDCTAAGAAHTAMVFQRYGQNTTLNLADADALAMYEAVSGYTPADPTTDVGATLQDALGYWRATGIAGHKIAAFAQIKPADLATVRDCIATFGSVYAGLNFPASAMDQFDAGKPWTVVSRSRVEGGHCVPLLGYDHTSFTCVTWGKTQQVDLKFFTRYFDECWVPISLDWLTATGASPSGLDTDALNADFMAVTGQPGPFPHHTPPPAPSPGPTSADAMFAAAIADFQHATTAWLDAHNL